MNTYYLNPTWDVIPRLDGVELYHSGNSVPLILSGAEMPELVAGLCVGMSQYKIGPLFELLIKNGVILEDHIPPKRPENNYLDLLDNHIIGPGRIVREVISYKTPWNDFHVSYATGFAPRLVTGQSTLSGGWGADADPLLTDIKAAVEATERYALAEYDETHQTRTLANVLDSSNITEPIDSLYHPVDYQKLGRAPIAPLNISGVAAHQSREAALTNALLELCEHEALMVAWFGRRDTPRIAVSSLDLQTRTYIARLEDMGWQVILKDISLDLVPVVMAIGLGPNGKRALIIGSCAAFTLRYAAAKALTEVIRTVLEDEVIHLEIPTIRREQVNDIMGHSYYYARPENLAEATFLWEGAGEIVANDNLTHGDIPTLAKAQHKWVDNPAAELNYIGKTVMASRGIAAYWLEMTPKVVVTASIPLFVVRTLAPEMARLTVGYNQRPARTKRFSKLLKKYGSGKAVNPAAQLTPFA